MAPKLIIVADLGTTKVYRVTKDMAELSPRVDLVHERNSASASERLADQVTDKAGRFPVSNGVNGCGMSIGENHGIAQENERRLIREIASEISGVVGRENLSRWDFAAAREINQRILEELPDSVRGRMGRNVGADLVKIPKHELLGHFAA